MSSDGKAPLKGHWPTAFALGGTLDQPALVPLNYAGSVLAGDEYCVPAETPADPAAAAYVESLLDDRGWVRMAPAIGSGAVTAVLSISDFSDRPLIVGDEGARTLAALSPVARACITLSEIQDAAREVMSERDPAPKSLDRGTRPIDQARNLAFAVYWAIGDGVTATRRRQTMVVAGWPESVISWIA